MVSDDFLENMDRDNGGSDDSGGSSSGSSSKKKGSSGGAETFSLDDDTTLDPDDVKIDELSENMSKGAELNYNEGTNSLSTYKKRQVKECKELYSQIEEKSKEYGDTVPEFTLYFHAMVMNMAQNRVGIATVISDNFGKSDKKALKITRDICDRAGETQTIMNVIDFLSRRMMES